MSPWIDIVCIVIFSGGAALVSYGALKGSMQADIHSLRRDLTRVEANVGMFVTRTEYESRHKDLQASLTRIESKVDGLSHRRGGVC